MGTEHTDIKQLQTRNKALYENTKTTITALMMKLSSELRDILQHPPEDDAPKEPAITASLSDDFAMIEINSPTPYEEALSLRSRYAGVIALYSNPDRMQNNRDTIAKKLITKWAGVQMLSLDGIFDIDDANVQDDIAKALQKPFDHIHRYIEAIEIALDTTIHEKHNGMRNIAGDTLIVNTAARLYHEIQQEMKISHTPSQTQNPNTQSPWEMHHSD